MMDNKTRNYVIECERITGDVWSPLHMFVDASVAAPVVRCKDCKHYTDDEMEYYHYCGSWCEQVTPDGYCAWGERRADHD